MEACIDLDGLRLIIPPPPPPTFPFVLCHVHTVSMPFCLRFCLLMPLPFSEDANFSSSTPDSQIRFGFVITLASTLGPEAALVLVALGFRGEMPKAGSLSQLSSVLFSHRASWAPSSSSLLFLSPSPGANICSESWERTNTDIFADQFNRLEGDTVDTPCTLFVSLKYPFCCPF